MFSRRAGVILFVIGFMPLAGNAAGQTGENVILRGIKTVSVSAQPATDNDKACGIDVEAAKAAATKTLLDGGVQIGTEKAPGDAGLGIRFTTLHFAAAAVCVSSIRVDIGARVFVTLAFNEEPVRAWITLEEQGALMSSARGDHPARCTQKIRDLTETIVGHLRAANQK